MNIGLIGNTLRPIIQQGMVYGYDVAVNEIIDSIFEYSRAEMIYCLYEPAQFQEYILAKKIKKYMRRKGINNIEMINEYDVLFHGGKDLPDIDILHNASDDFIPMVALRETMKKPIPITFTIHCASYPEMLYSYFLQIALQPLKSYDALICTSKAVRDVVRNILDRVERITKTKHKIRLANIPLGVDTHKFMPQNRKEIRSRYKIPIDAFAILWLGRFSAIDKADLFPLLLVVKRLIQKNQDRRIVLLLAGYQPNSTNYIDKIKEFCKLLNIEENVVFNCNHDVLKRSELYNISDVFTSPIDSIQETFGITPIEAMACGIPQIVSDWDGYKDTVKDGITGFRIKTVWSDCCDDLNTWGFLPVDIQHRSQLHHYLLSQSVVIDIDEYEKAFQTLIDNPLLLNKMSLESRKCAIENYSWETVIAKKEELWDELKEYSLHSNELFEPNKLLLPKYCQDFRGYPTECMGDDILFKTPREESMVKLEKIPLVYGIERMIVERDLLERVIEEAKEGCTINELISVFSMFDKSQIRRAVMFLYKYGFLQRI